MSQLVHRAIDIVLIVLGAFGAVHLNLNLPEVGQAHKLDPTLVAFVAALALSVFPAFGTYPSQGARSMASVASRTTFAWLAVQSCGVGLLYIVHRENLFSLPWFLYWTLTTGVSLLASHTVVVAGLNFMRQAGDQLSLAGWANAPDAADELPERDSGQTGAVRRFFKRLFDIVIGMSLIVLFLPLFVVLALVVISDGGPAVFGHVRVGHNGQKFRCLKFRSMVVNADEVLRRLLETDAEARAEWEQQFKLKHDVRITRVGRFLRRTSLDELPQLWNVLRGEMSLVGPRPIIDQELARYGANAKYYLMATPGMTGLWQVSGRSATDYATRVALDVAYVKNWSFLRDISILFKTAVVVWKGSGAC